MVSVMTRVVPYRLVIKVYVQKKPIFAGVMIKFLTIVIPLINPMTQNPLNERKEKLIFQILSYKTSYLSLKDT